ncbi:MAG TPA: outer membrane beta-barrel protein [Nitrospiria bacterium]|nr:outer membrane beta-barrel protein [Nitrospiria bacterium]
MARFHAERVWPFITPLLVAVCVISAVWTGTAAAQAAPASPPPSQDRLSIGVATGFHAGTADGTVFGLFMDGRYQLDQHLAIGPLLQIGVSSDYTLVGLSGQLTYSMTLPSQPHIIPYLQGGLGFVVIDADQPGRDDDAGFLIPVGAGVDFELAKNLLLGTEIVLNYTSVNVNGQPSVYMSWLFGLRFRFPG